MKLTKIFRTCLFYPNSHNHQQKFEAVFVRNECTLSILLYYPHLISDCSAIRVCSYSQETLDVVFLRQANEELSTYLLYTSNSSVFFSKKLLHSDYVYIIWVHSFLVDNNFQLIPLVFATKQRIFHEPIYARNYQLQCENKPTH